MIGPNYLLDKTAPPAPIKRALDQKVIPVLIDAAGGFETALERLAVEVRQYPGRSLAIAACLGALLSLLRSPRRT